MRLIRTGRQLGQAVKNVQRLRQILTVFAKYGYADLVVRMNLGKFLPGRMGAFAASQADSTTPERLRKAFEELGPTFVKLGQLLSTRSDILPEAYTEEFTKLQDHVQPLSFKVIKGAVERDLGGKLSELYASFEHQPLASASIAQVHEGRLTSGERVVIKVQRPEIEKIIDTDVSLLAFLAGLLERYIPESRIFGPTMIVDEFFRTLSFELDFVIEANNIAKMRENAASIPEIVIPKVYKNLSSQRVLTLEKLEGIRANDLEALEKAGINRKRVVEIGARAFFKSIMIDGLFHGDLHGGNLFVLEGDRLGVVDFGIVGRLSQKSRDQLANMVVSLITEDYENLCYEYAELGAAAASIDFEGFQREVRNTLSPYMGLSLSELNLGKILIEATKIATRYDIKVPGDWMLVFKAILTIEGMGRSLDPDFDILGVGQELMKDLVKEQYSPDRYKKDMMWVARDLAALGKILPRQIRWMFRKFNSNDFAFEIKSPDLLRMKSQVDKTGKIVSLSIISGALFLSSSIALQYSQDRLVFNYPFISVFYFSAALVVLLWTLFTKGK